MDPNVNIKEQRELAQGIVDGRLSPEVYGPRLAELVLALDEWRRKGGFDPYSGQGGWKSIVDRAQQALADSEAERIALVDAWRKQLEGVGVPAVTAANIVQSVLDQVHEERRRQRAEQAES